MAVAATINRTVRAHGRQSVDLSATLRASDAVALDVVLEDLSLTGFRIQRGPALGIDDRISLGLLGMGTRIATVVRRSDAGYGCEFDITLSPAELKAVLAAPAFQSIPFPSVNPPIIYPGASSTFPLPQLDPYSRRARLAGGLVLAAASWAIVALAISKKTPLIKSMSFTM